ncbi:hypothetical protein P153DRAFT_361201 [Dothidotthia symphoricarpi CBS 119687]|uniref:Uncharacterized protein n=1 Tax=Dothidotthia symphoricarpi CBS 119687 TaxID=1392245 RepID=A0A6A5ZYY3_9PLEO|nr:uncharacterized protein P153DRAFT_361201 [Dothidotthia symphoricarpi CBS 119687]KAF2124496.1 hypothetical protein P153DRAFT_361201 [Dothidotthia symphoricarpi CBS 119687]
MEAKAFKRLRFEFPNMVPWDQEPTIPSSVVRRMEALGCMLGVPMFKTTPNMASTSKEKLALMVWCITRDIDTVRHELTSTTLTYSHLCHNLYCEQPGHATCSHTPRCLPDDTTIPDGSVDLVAINIAKIRSTNLYGCGCPEHNIELPFHVTPNTTNGTYHLYNSEGRTAEWDIPSKYVAVRHVDIPLPFTNTTMMSTIDTASGAGSRTVRTSGGTALSTARNLGSQNNAYAVSGPLPANTHSVRVSALVGQSIGFEKGT